jgi:hypothetical protein
MNSRRRVNSDVMLLVAQVVGHNYPFIDGEQFCFNVCAIFRKTPYEKEITILRQDGWAKPRKRLIFALIVAVAVNGSCSSGTKSNINDGNTATNTVFSSDQNKAADLDKEAEREAEKWWQAAAEKCGITITLTGIGP